MSRKPSFLSLTDLFCGAGGASIGAEAAGCRLALGINHWQQAILTHSVNFPHAAHDCRDVSETHPSRYRSTHLLWASPECPKWSQARGKRRDRGITGQLGLSEEFEALPTEAEERSRVTMWDVVRYAEFHDYDAVVVENVVDVVPWVLLPAWYQAMEALGYAHRTLFLNSMFFGVPQSRDRWYVVFWRRGNRVPDLEFNPPGWCPRCEASVEGRQSFKKPARWTDRYGAQYLYLCPDCAGQILPYVVPALAAIDLGVRGERIGDRKKALAAATLARVQAGVDRYWNRPGVFDVQRDPKHRDVTSDPMPTQTGRQSLALYVPIVTHFRGTDASHVVGSARSGTDPLRTISAGGLHHGIVNPPLYVKMNGGVEAAGPMAHPADTDPLGALTARGHVGLVVPMDHLGPDRHNRARTVEEPLRTQGSGQAAGLLTPAGGTWRDDATTVGAPMPTRTARDSDGLLTPPLALQAAGNTYDAASGSGNRYLRCRPAGGHPLWALPGTEQTALVLANQHHNRVRRADEEPLPTQTTGTTTGLVTSYYGRRDATRPVEEPMGTVTGEPRHAFVSTYNGTPVYRQVGEPLPTCTSRDRLHVVEGGPRVAVEDCFFRMLMPVEIGLGMAFPSDYQVTGKSQRVKVRQYGLAVTPPVARWLLERVVESLR